MHVVNQGWNKYKIRYDTNFWAVNEHGGIEYVPGSFKIFETTINTFTAM